MAAVVPPSRTTYKGYGGVSIQIPNDGTNYQFLPLLLAKNNMSPNSMKYLVIQNDTLRSTANMLMGEGPFLETDGTTANPTVLSATNYGIVLLPGDSETFGGSWDTNYTQFARIWVRNDATGTGVLWVNIQTVR